MENEQTMSLANTASAMYDGCLWVFKIFYFLSIILDMRSQILACGWIGAKRSQL